MYIGLKTIAHIKLQLFFPLKYVNTNLKLDILISRGKKTRRPVCQCLPAKNES